NATIVPAMQALAFDLPTQLTWIRGEASALFSLDFATLRPLLVGRAQTDLDVVGGEAWLGFWTDVCTNETMEQLVQLLFPGDLVKQLHFMAAEGSNADKVKARVTAMPADQRVRVYDAADAVALIRSFSAPEQSGIVQLLGGTPMQQVTLLSPGVPLAQITWAT